MDYSCKTGVKYGAIITTEVTDTLRPESPKYCAGEMSDSYQQVACARIQTLDIDMVLQRLTNLSYVVPPPFPSVE